MKTGRCLFWLFPWLLSGCIAIRPEGDDPPQKTPTSAGLAATTAALSNLAADVFSAESARNVLILVQPQLASALQEELAVLENDLQNEKWKPAISPFAAESPEGLRGSLQSIYSRRPFAGIFLVGEYPSPRMWGYPIENPDQPGAADYFYMDLDGEWSDADGDGFHDTHTDGRGDRQPEVFVGRLDAGNLPGLGRSELDLMRDYFRRDHAYRTGKLEERNAALYATYAHTMYGWTGAENSEWTRTEILQSIRALYPETQAFLFDEEADPEDSTHWIAEFWDIRDLNSKQSVPAKMRFRELMGAGYNYLSIGIHGSPNAWGPDFFSSRDAIAVAEANRRLPVLVFSASCSTADIAAPDNLGGILTMAGSLVFVGFSAPSEMRWTEFVDWNDSLAHRSIGEAFLALQAAATPGGSGAVGRNVNWILLGDPTLRIRIGMSG